MVVWGHWSRLVLLPEATGEDVVLSWLQAPPPIGKVRGAV